MFDAIRNHRRILFFILILLIIPSFVLFGIERFTAMRDQQKPIASVNGVKITAQEFDAAHRNNTERMRQMFGAQFDVKMADTPEAKKATLDELIQGRVLQEVIRTSHLTVPDDKPMETLRNIPAIQQLPRDANGRIDEQALNRLLNSQNPPLTLEGLLVRLKQDLVQQQVAQAVGTSQFATAEAANTVFGLRQERREMQVALIKASDLASQINLNDADIETYYKDNASKFQSPEQASVEYVILNSDAVAEQLTVNADEVKTYYEQNKTRYSTPEQRRASHILIAAGKDLKPEQIATAKAKAESLLAEVKNAPATFADVAKKNSQDPGSAERGGDLDFFGKGQMVPPFEAAVFALKEGDISSVVQSDFGFHIIKLTGIKASDVKPFEAVKGEIETELKKQQSTKKFAETAEQFSNLVFENGDTLRPAADKLKLKVLNAQNVLRAALPGQQPNNPLANSKFLDKLFSDDSIKNKRNTEATEIAPNTLVSGRLLDYKAATLRPLAEVKDMARALLMAQRTSALAKQQGEAKLATNAADMKFDELRVATRLAGKDVPPQALSAAFKLDATQLPKVTGAEVPGLGYALVRVTKAMPAEALDANAKKQQAQQLSQQAANAEVAMYLEALKKRFNVKIEPNAISASGTPDTSSPAKP
jgi:peptidyl-prolyl cis-trans isomerase D